MRFLLLLCLAAWLALLPGCGADRCTCGGSRCTCTTNDGSCNTIRQRDGHVRCFPGVWPS